MRVISYICGVSVLLLAVASPALAQESAALLTTDGAKYLAMAIAIFGGAAGQGKIIVAALESIGRNPGAAGQMNQPWLLGIVFIEALFILAWLIFAGFIGG